jgi:hypothetical protein
VQIDKSQILELLQSRGQSDQADQAQSTLPDTVDTEQHANLLQQIGLTPQEIIAAVTGGGGIGGIAGRLASSAGQGDGGQGGQGGQGGDEGGGIGGALGGLLGR